MKYGYELFEIDKGYGYDILVGKAKVIHQPHMPCVGGIVIMTKEQAKKIAGCVCEKLEAESTPAVTLKDLSVMDCI